MQRYSRWMREVIDREPISANAGFGVDEKAKKEFPEAKVPIIGMNDERGGVCNPFLG